MPPKTIFFDTLLSLFLIKYQSPSEIPIKSNSYHNSMLVVWGHKAVKYVPSFSHEYV